MVIHFHFHFHFQPFQLPLPFPTISNYLQTSGYPVPFPRPFPTVSTPISISNHSQRFTNVFPTYPISLTNSTAPNFPTTSQSMSQKHQNHHTHQLKQMFGRSDTEIKHTQTSKTIHKHTFHQQLTQTFQRYGFASAPWPDTEICKGLLRRHHQSRVCFGALRGYGFASAPSGDTGLLRRPSKNPRTSYKSQTIISQDIQMQ